MNLILNILRNFATRFSQLNQQEGNRNGFYTRIDTSTVGRYDAVPDGGISLESRIPPPLQEGFLWEFVEIFRGSGHLSQGHREAGLSVHPGFDIADGELGDVLAVSTFLSIVGLICRRVIRAWHVGPVCTTFGTLRMPRLRSKLEPFGFNPSDPATALGNRFAMRGGFILSLCHHYGLICSIEQPRGSVMYRLEIFRMIFVLGYSISEVELVVGQQPFPLQVKLQGNCKCGQQGSHFRVQGTFDRKRLRQFRALSKPDVHAVFDRSPQLGEHVARFVRSLSQTAVFIHCKTEPVEDYAIR